jgi:hypothetical protein
MRNRRWFIAYAFFLFAFFLFHHPYYWDAGVYAGMGKFMFSLGNMGAWEVIRPPVLPAIEGFLWWIGLPFPLAGQLISYMFSLLLPFLVYKVGSHAFDKEHGLVAAFITAFHPLLLFFSSAMLNTTPALCFVLAAYWALYTGHSISSGFLLGLATLTRFPMGLFAIPAMALISCRIGKKNWRQLAIFCAVFFVTISFQLLLNGLLFGKPLEPLIHAQQVVEQNFSSMWYDYIPWIFLELGITLWGIYTLRHRWRVVVPLMLTILLPFIYFSLIEHKEPRYMVILIPFFALWSSVNVIRFKHAGKIAALILILVLWGAEMPRLYTLYPTEKTLLDYSSLNGLNTPTLITSPVHMLFLDTRVHMYHMQSYAVTKEKIVQGNISLIFNSCDIVCAVENEFCELNKDNTLKQATKNLQLSSEIQNAICPTHIFFPIKSQ